MSRQLPVGPHPRLLTNQRGGGPLPPGAAAAGRCHPETERARLHGSFTKRGQVSCRRRNPWLCIARTVRAAFQQLSASLLRGGILRFGL